MPLDKSMSHEDMVSELIAGYKKTGKIGATKPRDMKHALEIANAVAYNIEESKDVKKIYKEVKEMRIEDLLKSLEETISAKELELGIFYEKENREIKIDSSIHRGREAEYYQENLQGKIVKHPVLGDIYLGQKGRRETIYKSPSKYMGILCNIDKIIESGYSNGQMDSPKHARKDSFVGFYYIYNEVLYDNIPLGVNVIIGEAADGKKYYMFKASKNEKFYQNTGVLLSEKEAYHVGRTSNNSITDDEENIKSGDKYKLGDFIEITVLETNVNNYEEALNQKPSVKVEFDNGETIETEVADNATDEEIKNYYAKGKEFNLGQGGRDRLTKVKNVSVTRNVTESHTDFKDLANTYGIDYETFNKNHKFNDYDEIPEEWAEYIEDSNSTFERVQELFKNKGYFVEKQPVIETGYITFKIIPTNWRKRNLKTGVMEISRAELVTKNAYEVAQQIADEAQERYPEVFKSITESLEFIPTEVEFADDKECLENATDVISLDVPLFLRLLEWAREDATEDVDLHVVAENAVKIMQGNTEFLSMDEYEDIIKYEIPEMDMGDMGADPIEPIKNQSKKHLFTKDRLRTTPEDMEKILKELEELS